MTDALDDDVFRRTEKAVRRAVALQRSTCRHKTNPPPPSQLPTPPPDAAAPTFSFADVVDVRNAADPRCHVLHTLDNGAAVVQVMGYPPGLRVVARALSWDEQVAWAGRALAEYSRAEHTNLTNLQKLGSASVDTPPLPTPGDPWGAAVAAADSDPTFHAFHALRWASLGYHYDWTARRYQQSLQSPFPLDLAALCGRLAATVGEKITAEAAIVNYYPVGAYMSGHVDDAEHNMDEPIVSISLGCPAIFLLGGRRKSDTPTAVLVRSGDVVVMAGESRFSYHGVPAVLPHALHLHPGTHLPCADGCDVCRAGAEGLPDDDDVDGLGQVRRYLRHGRININCRRVARADGVWEDKCGSGAAALAAAYR